ncbi:MAG: MBL fold metallo-hydrolase [Candidatus Thermoplasmatota archaeon]|nr:MBL fold metallo-hydrolase [Candidatus Thermoplasmatota archaeon]|tara:strand:+ start:1824 stop:3131 length:1308 start_codon:yes stop_codon:yes gene_type:complete
MVLYTTGDTSTYPEKPPERGIRLHFLGGAGEVGNVGCILEDRTGTRLLIDYGLAPTKPPRYPSEAPFVTDAIMTHGHIDHIGMAPWLTGHGTNIHGTDLTAGVSEIMWADTYKVSDIEGYPLAWDKRDLEKALDSWTTHQFDTWFKVGSWKCRLHRAGHIPGAAMVEIATPEMRILWSGDIDTRDSPNALGAKPINCDLLCLEGTYGGRNHPDRKMEEQRFVSRVLEVVSRGGTALIPAFASGRGQDILRILHREAPNLDVHYDGMGTRITREWLKCPEFLNDPGGMEATFRWSRRVTGKADRKKALGADVIVTTSGMLDGGPALWYLNRLRHNGSNAILLTGFQAEGSGGRNLLELGRLPIFGKQTRIPLEIDKFELSNHADHRSLCSFAKECSPKSLVIFHADDSAAEAIEESLASEMKVFRPSNYETMELSK